MGLTYYNLVLENCIDTLGNNLFQIRRDIGYDTYYYEKSILVHHELLDGIKDMSIINMFDSKLSYIFDD